MKHSFTIIFLFLFIGCLHAQLGWQEIQTPSYAQLNGLYFLSESEGYVVGDSGVILHTVDGGQSWRKIKHPLSDTNRVFLSDITIYNDSVLLVAGSLDSGLINGKKSQLLIMRSNDRGETWAVDTSLGKGRLIAFVKSPSSLYVLKRDGGDCIYKSIDTGRTWVS